MWVTERPTVIPVLMWIRSFRVQARLMWFAEGKKQMIQWRIDVDVIGRLIQSWYDLPVGRLRCWYDKVIHWRLNAKLMWFRWSRSDLEGVWKLSCQVWSMLLMLPWYFSTVIRAWIDHCVHFFVVCIVHRVHFSSCALPDACVARRALCSTRELLVVCVSWSSCALPVVRFYHRVHCSSRACWTCALLDVTICSSCAFHFKTILW